MMEAYTAAVHAIELAIEQLDAEWESKRGALEEALEIVKADGPPPTRDRLKRRTGRENDADVLNYLRENPTYLEFTETEVAYACGLAQASAQASLKRLAELGVVEETERRERGRGHRRVSKVWRVPDPDLLRTVEVPCKSEEPCP